MSTSISVASHYAKNLHELELARNTFNDERKKLIATLTETLRATNISPTFEGSQKSYVTYFIRDSHWSQARAARNLPSGAGYTFALDHASVFAEGGDLTFVAYVFFRIGKTGFGSIPEHIRQTADYPLSFAQDHARACHAAIPFGDERFTLEAFTEELRALPDVFAKLDARITEGWEAARGPED